MVSSTQATEQLQTKRIIAINCYTAGKFLAHFGGKDARHLFVSIHDKKGGRPIIIPGTFDQCIDRLVKLNQQGGGIFFTVNETDGSGKRRAQNITRVRAYFLDLDAAPLEPVIAWHIKPDLVTETSPGKFYCYWLVTDEATARDLEGFKLRERKLIKLFNADPKVCDLARILRVPGFIHQKREPFRVSTRRV